MIAVMRGRYHVDLYANEQDISTGDAIVALHPDFFYDLFGRQAADYLEIHDRVELEVSVVWPVPE